MKAMTYPRLLKVFGLDVLHPSSQYLFVYEKECSESASTDVSRGYSYYGTLNDLIRFSIHTIKAELPN